MKLMQVRDMHEQNEQKANPVVLVLILCSQVLPDCSNVLGMHQDELLQEVARVMSRPAKPETEAGKSARNAAKEVRPAPSMPHP